MALKSMGGALSNASDEYASDEDPELVKGALPFSLKVMETILDAFIRRQHLQPSTAAPEIRVKAPPELIDDDVTQPKPDASGKPGAVPANTVLLPEKPKPELDQYGKPKPRDAKFIQREREWNLARQKKNQEGS